MTLPLFSLSFFSSHPFLFPIHLSLPFTHSLSLMCPFILFHNSFTLIEYTYFWKTCANVFFSGCKYLTRYCIEKNNSEIMVIARRIQTSKKKFFLFNLTNITNSSFIQFLDHFLKYFQVWEVRKWLDFLEYGFHFKYRG
ncbi:hypothetical protein RclHR1_26080001 [Rhizophagus clarus]|uniref:Uncharacterized protein n=1 Tax=Rhizophagus clarus TaxID=94130 RepID=A0A2Z6RUU8_9GLOM|nr:hypothetical protein RclHR1_26080001 [Rhizophagus clarus]